jgi:hypothetical protein
MSARFLARTIGRITGPAFVEGRIAAVRPSFPQEPACHVSN